MEDISKYVIMIVVYAKQIVQKMSNNLQFFIALLVDRSYFIRHCLIYT